ncbi:MAG: hypothetical protein PVJ01_01630 [Pseudomonadota bacterium]|jgi:hypothetical protein
MSETAAYMALIETASSEGVWTRQQHLVKHGPHELGWSYANILEMADKLQRQLLHKGFFRVYLYVPDSPGAVRYSMKISRLSTYRKAQMFNDPVDNRRYLIHSRMRIESISELQQPMGLEEFVSVDKRKPDIRHLQLGFLFVVDPEV